MNMQIYTKMYTKIPPTLTYIHCIIEKNDFLSQCFASFLLEINILNLGDGFQVCQRVQAELQSSEFPLYYDPAIVGWATRDMLSPEVRHGGGGAILLHAHIFRQLFNRDVADAIEVPTNCL